ncbi:SDR family NAD(P)-dependent oxidoreductase [Sporichthya brevicatena]|uniref:SDR family NAD(P)-dependent oxidoreductase n=1 Tax=Sporichthya brevicatena TaxID=171442 RepID=A0ABN1HBM8_9ACTN
MTGTRPLALVTGASSGIGLEFAVHCAAHGYDLVVNSEDGARLEAAGARLRAEGAQVRTVLADLRDPQAVIRLHTEAMRDGRPLEIAALNAGVGRGGRFLDIDLERDFEIIDLNVRSTVQLAKLVLRDMVARNSGRMLITSSIASTMPGTYQATYNASKSFLQSFAEALSEELADTDVVVTSLMPGPTDTDFFRRADMLDTRVGAGKKDDPAKVAEQAFAALRSGDRRLVGGSLKTRFSEAANKVLPDQIKAKVHSKMAEPGSGS